MAVFPFQKVAPPGATEQREWENIWCLFTHFVYAPCAYDSQ